MMRIIQKMKVFTAIVCLITKIATSKAMESNSDYIFTDEQVELTTGTLIVDTNCPAVWYLDNTTIAETEALPTEYGYNYTYEEYLSIFYLSNVTDYVDLTSVTIEGSSTIHHSSSPTASPHLPSSSPPSSSPPSSSSPSSSPPSSSPPSSSPPSSSPPSSSPPSSSPPSSSPPSSTCSNATTLEEIYGGRCRCRLSGVFERMKFVDSNGRTWNYSTAVFSVPGSIMLSGKLKVEVIGYHSVRLESLNGNISIEVPIDISGQNGGINKDNYAGGFGGKDGGPGAGSAIGGSGGPGGGGFGSFGGGTFLYFDNLANKTFVFGAEYSFTESLIGGSAGAKWDEPSVTRLRGGGAMELNAADTIYITPILDTIVRPQSLFWTRWGALSPYSGQDEALFWTEITNPSQNVGRLCKDKSFGYSSLTADGQSGPYVTELGNCVGGGSGGMFLFNASSIVFSDNGLLSVMGGNGSFNESQPGYCGGGGAGGVIQLTGGLNFEAADFIRLHTSMSGGDGHPEGEGGVLKGVRWKRGGRYGESEDDDLVSNEATVTPIPINDTVKPPPMHNHHEGSCMEGGERETVMPPPPPPSGKEKIKESTGKIKDKIKMKPPSDLRHQDKRQTFVKDVVDDFDQVLNETDTDSSEDVSTLVFEVEETVSLLAKALQEAKDDNETLSVTASNNAFDVVISIEDAVTYEGTAHQANQLSVYIPDTIIEDNFTDDVVTSLVFYNDLGENLDGSLDTAGENETYYANGRMLSVTIQLDNVTQLDFVNPIEIVFENINQNATEETTLCVYWSYNDTYSTGGVWSTYGCTKGEVNRTHTTCYCSHLTSFCVLVQVTNAQIYESHSTVLSLITYVGLSLSLVTLIITLIIMVVYFRRLNYECTSIHINLIIALIIANALFLFGVNKTSKKGVCTSIAIFLHYFYLVVFVWMAVEALHMYNKVRSLNQSSKRKFYMYYPIGWGVPAIIVIITMAVRIDGYGTDTACWLDIESGTVWAFIGPVIAVVSLNVFIIGMVLKIFSGVKSIKSKPKREKIRRTLRAIVILLPIFGVTWIFGLLAFNKQTLFFQYMFAIFNSLQGFLIFLFHCCLNVEIRNIICSRLGNKVDGTSESQSKSSSTRRTQVTPLHVR